MTIKEFQASFESGTDNRLFTTLRKLMAVEGQDLLHALSPLSGWPQWHLSKELSASEGPFSVQPA